MKIVFPSNPNNGDLYPDLDAYDNPLDNGLIYEYNNGIWNVICSASEEDAIYDRGTWDIDLDPVTNGGISLYDNSGLETLSYEDVTSFTVNEVDYYLTSHQYDVIEASSYIQLFNREGYGYALYKVLSEAIDNGNNTFTIEVEFIQANPNDVLASELISVRYLNVPEVQKGLYYQSTTPTLAQYDLTAGDIWINNDAYGNQYHTVRVYDGTSWDHINHVRKTGDTMTGTLVMSPDSSMNMLEFNPPASGTIKIRANNASGVTKTQLQVQGFTSNNAFEVSAGSNADEPIVTIKADKKFIIHNTTNYENADINFQRFADTNNVYSSKFSTLKSNAPIDAYGNIDSSDPFGIQFVLAALTTGKNRLRVIGAQDNPILSIHSGVNPVINLGTGFTGNNSGNLDVGGGVRVENVATPTELSPPHSAVNKGYVDTTRDYLQNEIIELEEEIEALAPSVERGEWTYNPAGTVAVRGQYTMYDDLFSSGSANVTKVFADAKSIWFNYEDLNGNVHDFSDVKEDQLLEIFEQGDSDYGLYTIKDSHDESQGATSFWVLDVSFVKSGSGDEADSVARFKIFEPPSGGAASEFVRKAGDDVTGTLTFKNSFQSDEWDPSNVRSKLTFENIKDGQKTYAHLFRPGSNSSLVSNVSFISEGGIYSSSYYYGWNKTTQSTYSPRINIESSKGYLRYNSTEIFNWESSGVRCKKSLYLYDSPVRIVLKNGQYTSTGNAGQVLTSGGSSNPPYWSDKSSGGTYVERGGTTRVRITKSGNLYVIDSPT